MPKRKTVFYAFPGNPPSLGETIGRALKELNNLPPMRKANVRFRPWSEVPVAGRQLIRTILQNIDRADVYACDLTYSNPNVTFELGYAIGRFKRVWVSLDTSIQNAAREYKRLYFALLGLGYVEYHNHQDLANSFLTDSPLADLDQTLLGEIYRTETRRQEYPTLLYLKPPITTDAVIATEEILRESIFRNSLILDDPIEDPSPTLEWYAGKLRTADAVAMHLLSNNHNGSLNHNVKCSLVAGLAHSFGKHLLMLAHTPFETPIDYEHLLESHDTARACGTLVHRWVEKLEPSLPKRRARRPLDGAETTLTLDLRRLSMGEPVAENERQRLDGYFVETSTYYRALEGPTTIVVGRRGTGKTAILYALAQALSGDKRNHVCIVKPVGYEVHGLVRVLRAILHRSERGYLVESLWKFLIYTELARSVFESLSSRPIHQAPSPGFSTISTIIGMFSLLRSRNGLKAQWLLCSAWVIYQRRCCSELG